MGRLIIIMTCYLFSCFILSIVFTIIVNQVFALNLAEHALETLKRYQQFKEKYQEQTDDDDISSLNSHDLDTLLELVLDAKKLLGRKEKNQNKKQNNQITLFDELTRLGDKDVLVYDPDSYQPIYTESQKEPLLDILKSSYDTDITDEVDDNETNRNKKQNIQATLFDQLTSLGDKDVLVYDPDSFQSINSNRQKEPLLDMLKSSYDKDMTDEVDDNSPVFVLVKADDSQRSEADSGINDMVSSLLKLSSLKQKDRYRNEGSPDNRYKRFQLKNAYRRAKDSDDTSSREMVDKRPQSRPRAFVGGRTPIPYLRHRGDIYERDI